MGWDVPVGHEKFGQVDPCVCRTEELAAGARERLYTMSNLDRLSHLSFDNFSTGGNPKAEFITPQEMESLELAHGAARAFAAAPEGWLLVEGGYGSGKTHLAAAIANETARRGVPTLFITVPDLLDSLRFAYSDPETTFEARFEEIRSADLLVMDDFGTQNATPWAQEKLFQIVNHRYINKLPTVVTTNLVLDEIEARIRSRLQDADFVHHVRITAPDYRRPAETSNPGLSMLSLPYIKAMTLKNFVFREDEVGKEIVTTTVVEKQDNFGRAQKTREIVRERVTREQVERLHEAYAAAARFAEQPEGWLVFLGPSYSGKTHLAAAIANYRRESGRQGTLSAVSDLLDYLKTPFGGSAEVTFDRRFYEVRTAPLLLLDDLKESESHSSWALDKLYQILNHRYYANLPTVLTSTLTPDDLARSYPSLSNRLLDSSKVQIHFLDVPPYRRPARAGKRTSVSRKTPGN